MCYSIAYLEKKAQKLAERYKDFFPADWSDQHEQAASAARADQALHVESLHPDERMVGSGLVTGYDELPVYYFVSGFAHPFLPVIGRHGIHLYQWGLVPFWVKDAGFADDIRTKTLNAMGETVFEKPSFRDSIRTRRCLLPVSGFYEWRELNKVKYPYFIGVKDEILFSLGCIYASWTDRSTGEIRNTFSILTTVANPLMEEIHNVKKRMPLIIGRGDEAAWVDPELGAGEIKQLIRPFDEGQMTAYTVSRALNNPKNERNIPAALEKVEYPELGLYDA